MLKTVRRYIDGLPDTRFPDFYQDYVMESELRVRNHRIKIDSVRFTSLDNISVIIEGLNHMTEELKTL